ncbi:MAG: hypothetical protein B7Y56_07110 [Gallionellales bacterium 35-53-114]|nr:MAG: hypothetical protein B7Y56_07110 [Gallionellales bacterium 35-53-114]OYZ63949.1 MAG: hypothetical protein B7Y04_08205 [Gallionellales bacterium 24-53-125]OZB09222.1 MAG: hypothetical protein B7X61_06005 [Gallionellales bacterium 39-52-133]HQS59180.1 hypothetical protein [Gallionellaceae bacterium]HQS75916.1 hypothetical protein [Gallionellaceae bacterium]
MEITCYRDLEVKREHRQLPAETYNLALTLLARSASGNLFIPIRSMQYLAILDAEEWVFLDGVHKCWIDIAWRSFRPQLRNSLKDPVSYDAVYYTTEAAQIMSRLQRELFLALQQLACKEPIHELAKVLKFSGQREMPAEGS